MLHLLLLLGIDSYYWSFLPKEPDAESGRTIRLVFHHGSVRYTSDREFRVFKAADGSWPFTALVVLMVGTWSFLAGDIPLRNGSRHKPGEVIG